MTIHTSETLLTQLSVTLPQILATVRRRRQRMGGGWLHLTSYFDTDGHLYRSIEAIESKIRLGHFQLFGGGPILRVQTDAKWSDEARRCLPYTENQEISDDQFFAWVGKSPERVMDLTLRLLTDLSAASSEEEIAKDNHAPYASTGDNVF